MSANTEISTLLRELGLTEIEAEAYLALLQASRGEAVSGYKVAQDMGRDPANLAKTLAALGRQGAVRVVQEKPRLFLPVSPDEFTGHVLERMAATQKRAVQLLREFEATPAAGTALALTGPDQVLERARLMLGGCRSEALIFASPAVCGRLSAQLDDLVGNRGCRLRIISSQTLAVPGAEIVSLSPPPGLQDPEATPWLELVVDREVWLAAQLRLEGTPQAPSGWWGEDPGLALVLAASLNSLETAVPRPVSAPAPGNREPEPAAIPEAIPEPRPEPRRPDPAPQSTEAEDDSDTDDGFQFILRHKDDD